MKPGGRLLLMYEYSSNYCHYNQVVTNIMEYCQTICKGDKSAALNLALTLSTMYNLDAATISEINMFINTGVYAEISKCE